MELYNYTRDRGYERYTPFVNDVKYHPVLKAKKSFASGILAAFTSSDTSGGLRGNGDASLNEDDGDIISDINKEPSSSSKSGRRHLRIVQEGPQCVVWMGIDCFLSANNDLAPSIASLGSINSLFQREQRALF